VTRIELDTRTLLGLTWMTSVGIVGMGRLELAAPRVGLIWEILGRMKHITFSGSANSTREKMRNSTQDLVACSEVHTWATSQ